MKLNWNNRKYDTESLQKPFTFTQNKCKMLSYPEVDHLVATNETEAPSHFKYVSLEHLMKEQFNAKTAFEADENTVEFTFDSDGEEYGGMIFMLDMTVSICLYGEGSAFDDPDVHQGVDINTIHMHDCKGYCEVSVIEKLCNACKDELKDLMNERQLVE